MTYSLSPLYSNFLFFSRENIAAFSFSTQVGLAHRLKFQPSALGLSAHFLPLAGNFLSEQNSPTQLLKHQRKFGHSKHIGVILGTVQKQLQKILFVSQYLCRKRGRFVEKTAEARKETGVLTVEKKDCFISYTTRTEADKQWAKWLEWFLRKKLGSSTLMQEYDSPPSGNFKMFMNEALAQTDIVVCVLSNAYMQSDNCREEWTNAKNLRVVKVDDCDPEGLLRVRAYIDLCGLDEVAAMEKLTREWMLPQRPEENPGFPPAVSTIGLCGVDEAAAMEKLSRKWVLSQRPEENPGFPPAVSTSTKRPEKPDVPLKQKPSTEIENEHVHGDVKPKEVRAGALAVLLWVAMVVVAFCFPTANPSDQIFDVIASLLGVLSLLGLLIAKKAFPAQRGVGPSLLMILLVAALGFFLVPTRLWTQHWQVIAMSPNDSWSDGKAYSAYTDGVFDLSRSRSIRLTFDSSQAGTKFRLRLVPANADLNKPSGVRWEMESIPSDGIVTLPLKAEDFGLKREDMRQLIQIAVLSGDNAWNSPMKQGADMQAVFHKIEVLTGK